MNPSGLGLFFVEVLLLFSSNFISCYATALVKACVSEFFISSVLLNLVACSCSLWSLVILCISVLAVILVCFCFYLNLLFLV